MLHSHLHFTPTHKCFTRTCGPLPSALLARVFTCRWPLTPALHLRLHLTRHQLHAFNTTNTLRASVCIVVRGQRLPNNYMCDKTHTPTNIQRQSVTEAGLPQARSLSKQESPSKRRSSHVSAVNIDRDSLPEYRYRNRATLFRKL